MGKIVPLFNMDMRNAVFSKEYMEMKKKLQNQMSLEHSSDNHNCDREVSCLFLSIYLDIDRDVDFEKNTLTVRGAVSFCERNQGIVTDGKTEAAQRVIPLPDRLADVLKGHHGLLCTKADGERMTESAFDRKYQSYITFLERELNGCAKRWYGLTREHKALLAEGKDLPSWQQIDINCSIFAAASCLMVSLT